MTVPGNLSSPLLATAAEAAAAAAGPIKSLRFNSGDSAYLNRTPSSTGNRRTWTYSCWVKRTAFGGYPRMFGNYHGGGYQGWDINFLNDDRIDIHYDSGGGNYIFRRTTTQVFRDPSAWYHIVVAVDTTDATANDRVKLYVNGEQISAFDNNANAAQDTDTNINTAVEHRIGYNYSYSDFYLADVYFIDGSQLDPTSFGSFDDNGLWQAAEYDGTFGTNGFHLLDFANEATVGHDSSGNENDFTANNFSTSAGAGNDVLFDVPTNGTQSDTGAGGEVSGNYATLNPLDNGGATLANGNLNVTEGSSASMNVRATIGLTSGKYYWELTNNSPDYYATSSGNTNSRAGISNQDGPINAVLGSSAEHYVFEYAGVSGGGSGGRLQNNNSSSDFGSVIAQNDVLNIACDFTAGKIWYGKNGTFFNSGNPANGTNASQTFTPGGKAWFPAVAQRGVGGTNAELNFGQRAFSSSAPSGFSPICTTLLPTPTIADGSAQFDTKLYDGNGSTNAITGLEFSPDFVWLKRRSSAKDHSLFDTVRGIYLQLFTNSTSAEASKTSSLTSFDSNGFTLGLSNRQNENGYTNVAWAWNAGANSNKTYAVTVVSDSGNKYRFDGHGTSAVTLDLEEGSTYVFDQSDSSNSGHPLRFSTTSDGTHNSGSEYTTGVTTTGTPGSAGAKTTIVVAASAPTLYYYCSSHSGMGGQANTNSTAGASNFDGGIQATIKANQTAGFSIGRWTGTGSVNTVGTGLSNTKMVILKNRDSASNWVVYHTLVDGSYDYMYLNLTNANASSSTPHTMSNTFKVGTNTDTNASGDDYLFYAFSPVAGYSAFGTYVGNNNADGPFLYTGFRPAFLLVKNASSSGYPWNIFDSARSPSNVISKGLQPNNSIAEYDTTARCDFLSNGIKIKSSGGTVPNLSGDTYIYAAFAENPFQANGGLAR